MIATAKLSGVEFDALPYEEGRKWELIDGELLEKPSPTPEHQLIVTELLLSSRSYLRQQDFGGVLPDVEFALDANTRVRPDIAVVLHDRWRELDRRKIPIAAAPNIAVEVISPSERSKESTRKVWTYLRRGVQKVWQVFPAEHMLVNYTADISMRVLQRLTFGSLNGFLIGAYPFPKRLNFSAAGS